jgi:hypothetical protein
LAESVAGVGIEPAIKEIRLKGSLTGSFDMIAKRLSALQMFSLKTNPDSLVLVRVESRNIQKQPFLFFIITIEKNDVVIDYSIGLDSSEKIRKLFVMKNIIAVLSLITDLYQADNTELFQNLDSSIDDVLNSISQQYSSLFNNYDSLFNKYREIKRLNIELTNANKNLAAQASILSQKNTEQGDALKQLETYSDESLMAMIEEWLDSHDGAIDINEFSGNYKLTPPRVEQILNKMVSLGYIELKG